MGGAGSTGRPGLQTQGMQPKEVGNASRAAGSEEQGLRPGKHLGAYNALITQNIMAWWVGRGQACMLEAHQGSCD